jgi:hypothetical protein
MIKNVPSKPLTLDLMETLDLFFRRACYHQNASYRNNEENKCFRTLFWYFFWYMIHPKKLRQRSYGTYKKWSKVCMKSKVRGFYGISAIH